MISNSFLKKRDSNPLVWIDFEKNNKMRIVGTKQNNNMPYKLISKIIKKIRLNGKHINATAKRSASFCAVMATINFE